MAVKVGVVKDKITGSEVTIIQCENGYESSYMCKTDGCAAKMTFVYGYPQRRHEKVIQVPSYFRLFNKEKEDHKYGVCPYNTKGSVEIIARDSDSNVLKALSENKYEFSLQVLYKPSSSHVSKDSSDLVSKSKNGNLRKEKVYKTNGKASSYVNTLNKVLTLRSKLEDDKELASLITLTYGKKKIKWVNFYFDVDHYMYAYNLSNSLSEKYPICINGIVSKVEDPHGKFNYSKIILSKLYIPLDKKDMPLAGVELVIANTNIDADLFNKGDEVLAYGVVNTFSKTWRPAANKEKENANSIKFLTMTMWLNHKAQIFKLTH